MMMNTVVGRRIGLRGTIARLVVGVAMLAGAVIVGITWRDALLGLVAAPLATIAVVVARGPKRTPIRLNGPEGHCVNCTIGALAFVFLPVAALVFYGSAMLLAAARGFAGCELFAVSNSVLGRDDEIACTLFTPIDALDSHRR
jgi:hypothetical protein